MKVALIHDWLLTEGGAEKVLKTLSHSFEGSIYTLFYDKNKWPRSLFADKEIYTSFLQKYLFLIKNHRLLLPLFPFAIERLDLLKEEVILSNSHSVAKGVIKRKDQLHICYCHTPMRYAWDFKETYLEPYSYLVRKSAGLLLEKLRKWDQKGANQVDVFIANSSHIAKRIYASYKKEATVIYPPVAVDHFFLSDKKEGYYITHSRLVSYKKIDLWVKAFSYMQDKRLLIVGEGPEQAKLKSIATKNVEFLGFVQEKDLAVLLAQAKAYLFAAEEDFGIAVVEAQAAGLPVLALKKGGALETVIENYSGLFFEEATVDCCIRIVKDFEKKESFFDPKKIRIHAEKFGEERFKKEMIGFVEEQKKVFYEDRNFSRR